MSSPAVAESGPSPTRRALAKTDVRRLQWLALTALALCVVNITVFYPGTWNNDSVSQYAEAQSGRYTDWHPPIMAYVWSLLLPMIDGTGGMLLLQLVLHWLGFWAVSDALARQGRSRAAWWMLFAGAFPLFIIFNGDTWKDVQMASAWISAFGLTYRERTIRNASRYRVALLVGLLAIYGVLLRTNAVFAFGPLLLYLTLGAKRPRAAPLLAAVLGITLAAIPLSAIVNRGILSATDSGSIRSLQLFDLAGIAYRSGDISTFFAVTGLGNQTLERCYTSYWWDGFSQWGTCREAWQGLDQHSNRSLTRLWLESILEHPGAYLNHRLRHLNSSLLFLVPAKHYRYAEPKTASEYAESERTTLRLIIGDVITKNFLLWPVVWLIAGIAALGLLVGADGRSDSVWGARLLLLSAILYSMGYGVVGVATGLRYHYWSVMACLTALIISAPLLLQRLQQRDAIVVSGVCALGITVAAGHMFRIADLQSLL